jgi:hypothetical protein
MTTGAQATVEVMIGEGKPFEDIEEYIATLALPSEQLGALWLLAWAEATDPVTRRRVVAEVLTGSDSLAGSRPAAAASASAGAAHDEHRLVPIRRRRSYLKRRDWQRRRAR